MKKKIIQNKSSHKNKNKNKHKTCRNLKQHIISMLPANKKLCSPPLNNILNFANILKPTTFIEETTIHSQ